MEGPSQSSEKKYDPVKQSFVQDEMTRFIQEIQINSKLFYERLISCKPFQLR